MKMNRRDAMTLGLLSAAALSTRAFAQNISTDHVLSGDGSIASDPKEIVNLWPGTPPGGAGITLVNRVTDRSANPAQPDRYTDQIGTPSLTVFRPDRPDGAAVILAPGGGYVREVLDGEAFETARRLNTAGVTAFVLRYRLPGEGWANRSDVPLQDAQRAMRLVRSNATRYNIDPARLGFMGFSAGGHVAASLATRAAARVYAPIDTVDAVDAHANFAGLLYPVITMGEGAHAGSRNYLLGPSPTPQQIATYSCEKTVAKDAAPSFICLAADDRTVPPSPNGIAMFSAMRAANIAAELHVFEEGGHGFGIAKIAGKPGAAWPDLFVAWARRHGFFKA
jgi:acetyl esterase/lipase